MAVWREWNGIVPSCLSFSAPCFLELFCLVELESAFFFSLLDFWLRFFQCILGRVLGAYVFSGHLRCVAIVAGHRRGKAHDYSAFMSLRVSETPELGELREFWTSSSSFFLCHALILKGACASASCNGSHGGLRASGGIRGKKVAPFFFCYC